MAESMPVTSTQLRVPMNDLTIEGVKVENALLHRRLILLTSMEVRLRAALELATGVPWDSENITDLSGDQLEEMVANNMAQGLHISLEEARKRIKEHKQTANPNQVEISSDMAMGELQGGSIPQDVRSEKSKKAQVTIKGKPAVSPSATAQPRA